MPIEFKGMIFEGGGPSGVGHVGALQIFKEKGILENIKYFAGSSAGSIVAGALACQATPEKLHEILFNTDFNDFMDTSKCFISDFHRLYRHYGWYKGDRLYAWYGKILEELTGKPDITFKEVYERYGNYLGVTVTSVNTGETIYLNHENNPDMEIRTAVKRSSIMPLFFQTDYEDKLTKVIEKGKVKEKMLRHYYTDGGLLNNYPIQMLDHLLKPHEIIGFKLMSSKELVEMNNDYITNDSEPPKNVLKYISLLYTILRNQALRIHIESEDWNRTVRIDVGTISGTDFKLSESDKYFLITQGRNGAEKFLKNYDPATIYQGIFANCKPDDLDEL